jgi:hypothetical protein
MQLSISSVLILISDNNQKIVTVLNICSAMNLE